MSVLVDAVDEPADCGGASEPVLSDGFSLTLLWGVGKTGDCDSDSTDDEKTADCE